MERLSMISPVADPLWKRFVTGRRQLNSPKLAISILEKNIRLSYQRDPSAANILILVKKAHDFFTKYESVFVEEFQIIAAQNELY